MGRRGPRSSSLYKFTRQADLGATAPWPPCSCPALSARPFGGGLSRAWRRQQTRRQQARRQRWPSRSVAVGEDNVYNAEAVRALGHPALAAGVARAWRCSS